MGFNDKSTARCHTQTFKNALVQLMGIHGLKRASLHPIRWLKTMKNHLFPLLESRTPCFVGQHSSPRHSEPCVVVSPRVFPTSLVWGQWEHGVLSGWVPKAPGVEDHGLPSCQGLGTRETKTETGRDRDRPTIRRDEKRREDDRNEKTDEENRDGR